MPLRFRRSIRIVPGLRLGLGRRGVSASATLPGTGISYTLTTPHGGAGRRRRSQPGGWGRWLICTAVVAGVAWWFGWL
jgi:hypothetical protein